MTHDDLVLDVCYHGCGGIWFDNYELRHAVKSERSIDVNGSPQVPAGDSDHTDSSPKRPCPKCNGIRMFRRLFSDTCRIEIDECPGCGGIWLDQGEFEHIRASLTHGIAAAPVSALDPETIILVARLEAEMEQSRQHSHARLALCKFIGRRYHYRPTMS